MNLTILWFISKMVDFASTKLLLLSGKGIEVNPLPKLIMQRFGDYGIILFSFITSLLIYLVWKTTKDVKLGKRAVVVDFIKIVLVTNFVVSVYNVLLFLL